MKVPCRKCSKCGKYSDLATITCVCGENLKSIRYEMVESDDLEAPEIGKIDTSIKLLVQKCGSCKTLNFTLPGEDKVNRCYKCGKIQIKMVNQEEYVPIQPVAEAAETEKPNQANPGIDEAAEADNQALKSIYDNIAEAVANEAAPTWEEMLGLSLSDNKKLTLVALNHGELTCEIASEETPYLLGRSANLKDFLSQDGYVGNEHCYILYEDGKWLVKDNSRNGVFVGNQFAREADDWNYVGKGNICELHNNVKLKLGHFDDSIIFKVLIEE